MSLSYPPMSSPHSSSLMETWEKPISSSSHHRHTSFSSSLLDQIYRSIDDSSSALESTRKKKHHQQHRYEYHEISPAYHRRSVAADNSRSMRKTTTTDFFIHSSSSSSDSSNGGFSSSESDSFYGRSKSSASPPPLSTRQQPKPIRTSTIDHSSSVQKPKELGGFLRTKSKALKIYYDLKKVKQPMSPGGRLASFLNSLFTNHATTKPKKQRKKTTTAVSTVEVTHSSTTCSSASSFSRSCLSKTPSSTGKSKRSVRFCPVNVIFDEDSSSIPMPYAYNNRIYGSNEAKRDVMEEHRRVIEAAKDLLRTYHNKNMVTTTYEEEINMTNVEEDDVASCASSDLFELENLSAVGIERYREELPVYETTRLDTMNRAMATGLLV